MTDKVLIPLHVHSCYSLLDSLIKIEDYVAWGLENNMPALALTEHGNLGSSIAFYKECNKNNIKPILGIEIYMTNNLEEKERDNYHLILLAKNKTGWLNIIKLHNLSYHNMYYKPRVTYKDLQEHSEGIICTSACLGGHIPKLIANKDMDGIQKYTSLLKSIFNDDFYIELQDHGIELQRPTNEVLVQVARAYDIKLIATNDSHYTKPTDSYAHEVLLCKQTGKKMSDENRMNFGSQEFYLKNTAQMTEQLGYLGAEILDEIYASSASIYNKVENYDILQKEYNYPKFGEKEETIQKLKELTEAGFRKRFTGKDIDIKVYIDRLQYELTSIYNIGFTDYFLVLHDLYEFCERENIATGFGRGSGAGSLVLYCLYATHLDPIEHNLLFERFINPERVSAPDVDCDVEDLNRGKVIEYIENKYGKDYVCNIATYGRLTSVSAFKAVASVLEMPFMEANRISKELIDTNLSLQENIDVGGELEKLYNVNPEVRKIIETAMVLEGGKEKRGVHAAGIVISNQNLENLTPIMHIADTSKKMINCSSYEMSEIDGDLKLLKLDILGLKNLSIVKECIARIGNNLDFKTLDFKDEKTYKLLQDGETMGVFQLESDIMRHLCKEICPVNLADISVINAGARPGALESGLTESFIKRRKGLEEIDYVVDGMEGYLKDTLGLFIYQEQVMQLSQVMAGYTMPEADGLRKIIGKKQLDKLPIERDKFIKGSVENGHNQDKALEVFEMIEKFGRYGFNASHSYAYSALSYVTAYLKANYPVEYMTSLLNANSANMDKLTPYIDECYKLGINVLPPDINISDREFGHDTANNAIRFGFNGIKSVGESSIQIILLERVNGNFDSFSDIVNRIPSLNKTALSNLIKCGALNHTEQYPYKFLPAMEFTTKAKTKSDYKNGKINFYNSLLDVYATENGKNSDLSFNLMETTTLEKSLNDEKKTYKDCKVQMKNRIDDINKELKELKIKKQSLKDRLDEAKLKNIDSFASISCIPSLQEVKSNEIELIGFPISCNPKKEIINLSRYISNDSLVTVKEECNYGEMISFMGRFKSIKKTRNGSYFAVLTDDSEEITTFIKSETYQDLKEHIESPGNYFRVYGRLNQSNSDWPDNLKLEGIRYFNTQETSEVILSSNNLDENKIAEVLTLIKEDAIMNSESINYRLAIYTGDKKINTKIDYWISSVSSIGNYIIRYNMSVIS